MHNRIRDADTDVLGRKTGKEERVQKLTVVDRDSIFWPRAWDSEEDRRTRYPRAAGHWFASRRVRRDRAQALCAELDAIVARRLRSFRVQAGLRQVDLAEAIGVTQATISRIESGASSASFADVVRIAIQLDLPLEALFTVPGGRAMNGWEYHPTTPIIPRELFDAAENGELPEDHPIYD
jgi:transcriptional regulator with XRE-family HTH domain